MSDPHDKQLQQLAEAVCKLLAGGVAPTELSMAQRERLKARVLLEARDTSSEGTVTVRAKEAAWVEIAPFIQIKLLGVDPVAGIKTSLVRMQPGGCVPAHRHTQEEHLTVLEGECCIGSHRLKTGDVHIAAAGSWHEATTTQTGVLVLLRGEFPVPVEV